MRTSSIGAIIAALIVVLGIIQMVRPVSHPVVSASVAVQQHVSGAQPALPWPSGVQADIGVPGIGNFPQHGPAGPRPIGSMAKMMTAYVVLKAHPLGVFRNGPSITVTQQDVNLYQQDAATQQSAMPVVAGDRLSELTLLEGLLVPSGNNIATMLAQWVSGSSSEFAKQMNQAAQAIGLKETHYHGPVGLDPSTVSTAADQMKLSMFLMKDPLFQQIVAMPQMFVPGQSQPEYNYNYLIGHDNIIGVKTGSTTLSGGCVVLARTTTVDGHPLTVYASVVGQAGTKTHSQLVASLNDAKALVDAASKIIRMESLVRAGETVGHLTVPWQSSIPLVATKSVTALGWSGLAYSVHLTTQLPNTTTIPAGTVVGTLSVSVNGHITKVPVRTAASVNPPSFKYRLLR